ncbi:hypothetical protein HYX05_04270 [Candidatus Woesearchaeota archaeon]|nr:hypothetical protein [Candidatus Woesearchaeota archaeon]
MSNVERYRAMVATYRIVYNTMHIVPQARGKHRKPEPVATECSRAIDSLLRDAEEFSDEALVPQELSEKMSEFEGKHVERDEDGRIVCFYDEGKALKRSNKKLIK